MVKWPNSDPTKSWNPTKVLSNYAHKNVIFILNVNVVFIISTENHNPSYIDTINLYT